MSRLSNWLILAGVGFSLACGGDSRASGAGSGTPAATAATAAVSSTDPRAAIFVAKGCPQCHSISGLGIKSATEVGPDLTRAEEDVESRFGMELDAFLRNPTGTMMVVLSSQIQLTEAEKDSIIRILKALTKEES